jgi:hypothetical protein
MLAASYGQTQNAPNAWLAEAAITRASNSRPCMTLSRSVCPLFDGAYCFLPPRSFPQEEILEDEFPFAVGKRRSAHQAFYCAVNCFETGLDFGELI